MKHSPNSNIIRKGKSENGTSNVGGRSKKPLLATTGEEARDRISAHALFGFFTEEIIKERTTFVR
jgi:hypothetical protein